MQFEKKAKIISAVVTVLAGASVLLMLLLLYLRYTGDEPRKWPPEDTSELLLAGEYVAIGDIPEPAHDSPAPAPENSADEVITGDDMTDEGAGEEPAPPVSSKVESPVKVKEKPMPKKPGPTKEELAEREKERRQMEAAKKIGNRVKFGSSTSSSSSSTGKSGSPNGNAATGALSGQPGTNLKGRSIASWQKPSATATGTITVTVRVNRKGAVVAASYTSGTGAVASMAVARRSCEQAALQSSFSVDEDAPAEQVGTITYRFE